MTRWGCCGVFRQGTQRTTMDCRSCFWIPTILKLTRQPPYCDTANIYAGKPVYRPTHFAISLLVPNTISLFQPWIKAYNSQASFTQKPQHQEAFILRVLDWPKREEVLLKSLLGVQLLTVNIKRDRVNNPVSFILRMQVLSGCFALPDRFGFFKAGGGSRKNRISVVRETFSAR